MGAICVIGDSDSHGGSVLEGSSRTTVAGIGVTYVGASVSSDSHDHSGKTIVSSSATGRTTVLGGAVAGDGAGVSCGATVGASHNRSTVG